MQGHERALHGSIRMPRVAVLSIRKLNCDSWWFARRTEIRANFLVFLSCRSGEMCEKAGRDSRAVLARSELQKTRAIILKDSCHDEEGLIAVFWAAPSVEGMDAWQVMPVIGRPHDGFLLLFGWQGKALDAGTAPCQ